MEEKPKKFNINKKELWRTVKFTLFSISAGVIQMVSSLLLKLLILDKFIPDDASFHYMVELNTTTFIADTIGLALSILWNFTFNRKFTFKAANNVPIAMLLAFVFYIPFYHFQIWYIDTIEKCLVNIGDWGFVIALGTCMIINFILEYLWQTFVVFRGAIDTNDVAKKEQDKNTKYNIDELLTLQTTDEQKIAVQQMADLVEGRMTIREFWKIYQESNVLQDMILNDEKLPVKQYIVDQFDKADINILGCRVDIYTAVNNYFARRNIFLKTQNSDVSLYRKLLDLVPSYIDIGNGEFFANTMAKAPKELKSKEKDEWFRNEIRGLFTWDEKKPSWIQPPEWPIVDNVPYIFSHQATAKEGYECYYFYDPNDKTKTVVIEQCE